MKILFVFCLAALGLLSSCIRPQSYRSGATSVAAFNVPASLHSKQTTSQAVYEAYIEFDARGHLFNEDQVDRAVNMIRELKHPAGKAERPVSMFLFVHGWKNNASEASGNVWGFREVLFRQAAKLGNEPAIGVYIGWPGDVTKVGKFFSFWNRENVADAVGGGELDSVLSKLLTATKGEGFRGSEGVRPSTTILIGHSLGGLILERSVIRLISDQLAKYRPNESIPPPADLIVLLNEAGPAAQARPFLLDLLKHHLTYDGGEGGQPFPLLVAMTSDGDAATKIGFPGGEFLSANRPVTTTFKPEDPDVFGQNTTLPYNLLAPANLVALRSHEIKQVPANATAGCLVTSTVHNRTYCVTPIKPQPANTTPYWIMALPQVFVPDHSSVFREEMARLIDDFVARQFEKTKGVRRPPLKLYKTQ